MVKLIDTGDLLTVVCISSTPKDRKDLGEVKYINEVHDKTSLDARHEAFKSAIAKVTTPFVLFMNATDKFITDIVLPAEGKGISYGDLMFSETWGDNPVDSGVYSKENNLNNPYNIRRAILRTECADAVLNVTSGNSVDTETVLYTAIPLLYGHQYSPEMKIIWDKNKDDPFRELTFAAKNETKEYLVKNLSKLKFIADDYSLNKSISSLKPITDFKDELTVVTLSKDILDREDLNGLPYVNHVSTISSETEYFVALKSAIRKVNTPYFIFVDSDDKIPETIVLPSDEAGLVYGDFFVRSGKIVTRIKTGEFSQEKFFKNPLMIHIAVYNTAKARKVFEKIGVLSSTPKPLANYFIAELFGAEYNKDFVAIWERSNSGSMHTQTPFKIKDVSDFIVNNQVRLRYTIIPVPVSPEEEA